MTTSWTRTAGAIGRLALQKLGVQGPSQPVPGESMEMALDALNVVLKELPLYGYAWPKLSGLTSLAWPALTLPSDFYGDLTIWADGRELAEMTTAQYTEIPDLTRTGGAPTHFYLRTQGTLYLYPVPTTDPSLTILYQKIVDDVSQAATPNLPQFWLGAIPYGVAAELLNEFDIPEPRAQRLEKTWMQKRDRASGYSISGAPIVMDVDTGARPWGPDTWQAPNPIPDGYDAGQEP